MSGTQAVADDLAPQLRVRAADVEIVAGPDAGTSARLDRPTFVIGSGESADLRLTDDTVSREHLRLTLACNGVRITDAGSRNGTWLGSVRLHDFTLTGDATLAIGTTQLTIRMDKGETDLPLSPKTSFGSAIGVSDAMRHLFALLERAAQSEVTVLLEGESGAGKEVLARALHETSPRVTGPFVAVDCGALPPGVIESELFGHEKGAFTGATTAREGVFEEANGGTLFLDEIGELPLDLQAKLLRVLETREVRPVGARGTRPIDVRVVAATNKNLADASQKKEFRRDLFYRLAVARVVVPPLRARSADILPLARRFLQIALRDETADVPPDLAAMLVAYSWPGNVRELRNVIDRWALLGVRDARGLFDSHSALEAVREAGASTAALADLPYHEARRVALERFEQSYLPAVLERAGGVVKRAAEHAEVARPSFHRMLERAGLGRGSKDES
jgi:transcriptional regulator with PAS, ATPase and Fis domain